MGIVCSSKFNSFPRPTYSCNRDVKDGYAHIGENGAIFLWYNRGATDDGMAMDGLHLADVDGDGVSCLPFLP